MNIYKPMITLSGVLKITGFFMIITVSIYRFVGMGCAFILPIVFVFAGLFTEQKGKVIKPQIEEIQIRKNNKKWDITDLVAVHTNKINDIIEWINRR